MIKGSLDLLWKKEHPKKATYRSLHYNVTPILENPILKTPKATMVDKDGRICPFSISDFWLGSTPPRNLEHREAIGSFYSFFHLYSKSKDLGIDLVMEKKKFNSTKRTTLSLGEYIYVIKRTYFHDMGILVLVCLLEYNPAEGAEQTFFWHGGGLVYSPFNGDTMMKIDL